MTNDDGYEGVGIGMSSMFDDSQDSSDETFDLEVKLSTAMAELREARVEIIELNAALILLKKFAVDNGLNLEAIGGYSEGQKPLQKKLTELTKEELAARNSQVTSRQAARHASTKEAIAQPSYEELDKMYKDRLEEDKKANPASTSLVELFVNAKNAGVNQSVVLTTSEGPTTEKETK